MTTIVHTDPAPTLDDVWRLFRETNQQIQEMKQLMQEQKQEAERRFQETEHWFKEQRQETVRRFKETEKSIGKLGNRLGEFVEGFIAPAAVRLFKERNINVHAVSRNVETDNPELGLAIEIDLLVKNGDTCILIEVKSNLSIDDVNEHLERMTKFKPLFPEYTQYKVYGAVAGMVIPKDVGRYAYRKGFFVIGQTGDSVKFLNDEKFKPVEW